MSNRMMKSVLTVSILSAMLSVANAAETDKAQQQENESQPQDAVKLETMVLTAEEQVKQSLGVSIITEEDLDKLPVTNDISEYVRRMPCKLNR